MCVCVCSCLYYSYTTTLGSLATATTSPHEQLSQYVPL